MISTWMLLGLLTTIPAERCAAPEASVGAGEALDPLCADGVVKDDGTVETGYGWVPSVVDGRYVQRFSPSDFSGRSLVEVCVCWLRTRADDAIDFEVVVYEEVEGAPSRTPLATFPARAEDVPQGIVGEIYSIPLPGLVLPREDFFIGVAWDPSADDFFFVCADHSEETPPVEAFFIDDRADEWASVFESNDPIFQNHAAIMVRAVATGLPVAVEIPTLGSLALSLLGFLIGGLAMGRLLLGRSRSRG